MKHYSPILSKKELLFRLQINHIFSKTNPEIGLYCRGSWRIKWINHSRKELVMHKLWPGVYIHESYFQFTNYYKFYTL